MKKATMAISLVLLLAGLASAGPADKAAETAEGYLEDGNIVQAEAVVDSALVSFPDDYKLLTVKGKILQSKSDYQGALQSFDKALLQKSKDPDALYGAGMVSISLDSAQKALEYFERGIDTKKRKDDFLYGKALAEMKLGKLADADADVRKAINHNKKNPVYHRALGDINYGKQVWSIAISEYKQSMELDSTQTDLLYKIARAFFFSRNFTDAVKYYRDYLKIAHTDTTAWRELGLILEKSNNPAEAVFCYKTLTELLPNDGENWFKLGELQFGLKNYQDAGVAFEKAVALGVHVPESYQRLATIYQYNKEYFKADSAYARFEQAMGAPDDPEYWSEKGKVMLKIGQKDASFFKKAELAFDKAISLDSTDATNWEYGGLARYYRQDFAAAIPYFIKRLELGGENVNALRNLAFCYLKTEQYPLAASTLEKALALKPDDATMRQMVGKIYVYLQKYPEALVHLKIALADTTGVISASDKCKISGDIGSCYVQLREPTNAIPPLERAIKCEPKNTEYLLNLASAYHLDQKLEKANEYYKAVLDLDPNNRAAKEGYLRTKPR